MAIALIAAALVVFALVASSLVTTALVAAALAVATDGYGEGIASGNKAAVGYGVGDDCRARNSGCSRNGALYHYEVQAGW